MSDARHDQATIDELCAQDTCPSWWACEERGCYEQAKANYANGTERRSLPGDPGYLSVNDRSEEIGGYGLVADMYGAYKQKGRG